LRRRNVMDTVSETTLQVKDFEGMRLTRAPLRENIGGGTARA